MAEMVLRTAVLLPEGKETNSHAERDSVVGTRGIERLGASWVGRPGPSTLPPAGTFASPNRQGLRVYQLEVAPLHRQGHQSTETYGRRWWSDSQYTAASRRAETVELWPGLCLPRLCRPPAPSRPPFSRNHSGPRHQGDKQSYWLKDPKTPEPGHPLAYTCFSQAQKEVEAGVGGARRAVPPGLRSPGNIERRWC